MKLRNKKTGEIVVFGEGIVDLRQIGCNNVAEMMDAGWEDYEEPKEFWFIDADGKVKETTYLTYYDKFDLGNFGNLFETKEEAEKVVEKLKAWKRLRDGGITFKNWTINQTGTIDCFATWGDNIPPSRKNPTLLEDLDLLFGGEE